MNKYLGSIVDVIIDRPIGSRHPQYNFFYPVNYGYIPNTKAGDGKEVDAYVLGEFHPLESFTGRVIGIIKRKDDNEDKLVVAKRLNSYSKSDIEVLTEFQERYFDSEVTSITSRVSKPRIRVTTIGLVRRGNEILVTKGVDLIANKKFYRFPGGGIEFWETSQEAIRREFLEELNTEIVSLEYLDKIEHIFEFEREKKHEVILLYEIKLPEDFYKNEEIILDENGAIGRAFWIDKNDFLNGDKAMYPKAMLSYI